MRKLHLMGVMFMVLVLPNSASAAFINIDFGDTVAPNTYGAIGEIGEWNKINTLGTSNLFDTDNIATSVNLTLAASIPDAGTGVPSTDSEKLMFDNFYSFSLHSNPADEWTIDFTGLDNGLTRLIIYAPSNSSVSTGLMTVNDVSYSELFGSVTADLIEGVSYMTLDTNVTDGTLSLSGTTIGSVDSFAGLAGIQISSVPIPSAVWLFGSGLIGLIGFARRKA